MDLGSGYLQQAIARLFSRLSTKRQQVIFPGSGHANGHNVSWSQDSSKPDSLIPCIALVRLSAQPPNIASTKAANGFDRAKNFFENCMDKDQHIQPVMAVY